MFEVIKRDGRIEHFDAAKIEKVIKVCAEGLNIDLDKFSQKLALFLKPRMTTREIQHNLITAAISLIVTEDNKEDWSRFANRLILVDFKKEIRVRREQKYKAKVTRYGFFVNFEDFYRWLNEYIEKGIYSKLLREIPREVMEELYYSIFDEKHFENPLWNKAKHMQTQKFIRSYLTEEGNFPIELPEEVWFLQSLIAFLPSVKHYGKDWEYYKRKVLQHYRYLSEFLIIPATPQMLNLRRAKANLSSCFILDVNDNTESIVHTQSQIAQISRNAGGVGLFVGKLRPSGSWIKGNRGKANKITDWIKIYEATVNAFNQQGKRKGSITVALPVWHKDIFEFLECIDLDIGEIPKKSPDVFTQVVIPDFFFKYVNENRPFYLIDLHEITNILGRKDLDLIDAYGEEAERRYNEIVKLIETGKVKNYKKVNPREILRKIFYYWGRKGLPYIFFEDNANVYSPFEEKIYSANLCVVPGTKILTKEYGYIEIEKVAGQLVHVWNGEEWSLSAVFKTGENYTNWYEVEFTNGEKIICTDYHRWYIKENPKRYGRSKTVVKRTYQLKKGDLLEKWELPVIEGNRELPFAYENGLFTAEGTSYEKFDLIYLYGEKKRLLKHLRGFYRIYEYEPTDRVEVYFTKGVLQDKFFVPDATYSIESRIRWLEGLFDGDGTLTKNGRNQSLQLVSTNREFLVRVKRLLETLGVDSKITEGYPERKAKLPDGRGGFKEYKCKATWRLLIPSSELQNLIRLGFNPKRLKINSQYKPNRNAKQFVRVKRVKKLENFSSDSYCFYEPKLNRGILNGVLTGNCVENFSPFKNTNPKDLYCITDEELGYIHTCNITNVNLLKLHQEGYFEDLEKLKEFVFHLYEYMDNLIDITDLPVKESKKHNRIFRTVTAGFMGLADLFVAKSMEDGKYYGYRPTARNADKRDTLRLIDETFGKFAFLAVLASTQLAKERGKPSGFEKTKYPEGIILGRFNLKGDDRKFIADLIGEENLKTLEENLQKYGIRNTLLLNCPPNTSTSILAGVSAGVMPTFNLTTVEDQQTGLFVNFVPLIQYRWFYDPYKNFSTYEDYKDLTDIVARIQRYIDAGISFEITVNHNYFDTPEKLTKLFALVLSESRRKGIKAIYYWRHILRDKTLEIEECESCAN